MHQVAACERSSSREEEEEEAQGGAAAGRSSSSSRQGGKEEHTSLHEFESQFEKLKDEVYVGWHSDGSRSSRGSSL